MPDVTSSDLERLAERIERHADGHFRELKQALAAHDERIRDVEVQLGRHGERLTAAERDGENQWSEIAKIRNGGRTNGTRPATWEGESWRRRARAGGGLALLVAILETLHQLGQQVMDWVSQLRG